MDVLQWEEAGEEAGTLDEVHNQVAGEAAAVVQAGHITGDVHVHAGAAAKAVPARPIGQWNPFDLGVHRAITVSGSDEELPDLPGYLRRAHDASLAEHLGDLTQSVMIVVSGESSTGKTRALYELVHGNESLRSWPLLYPRTADDLLRAVESGQVAAGTVVWLNETHNHLSGPTGDLAAAALRGLLDGSVAGPVVVLGTLWPQFWSELVAQPRSGRRDEHANARALLQHRVRRVRVAERFSEEEVAAVHATRAVDPRLAAAASADGRRVIQTMAGGPALVERYEYPDDADDRYATAILTAAIDARRLGHDSLLPFALLADAAGGYLDEQDRTDPPSDWFARGLVRAANDSVLGVTALVARRTRSDPGPADGYELHDYVDQHGRSQRAAAIAPASLWSACLAHAAGWRDLLRLAENAYRRLLYEYADPMADRVVEEADVPIRTDLVDVLSEYGRVEKAVALVATLDSVTSGVRRSPWFRTGPHNSTAESLLAQGRSTDAETLLRALLQRGVQPQWVWQVLAEILIGQSRYEECIDLLSQRVGTGTGTEPTDALDIRVGEHRRHRTVVVMAGSSRAPVDGADRLLADLLADKGRWDEALGVARAGDPQWARPWLAKRFAQAGQLDRLRSLARMADPEVSAILWEALLEHGNVAEALDLSPQFPGKGNPSPRLLELLVQHGHTELAVNTVDRPGLLPHDSSLRALAEALVAHGHRDTILELLRRLAVDATEREIVADLLADLGCWDEALDVAKRATGDWVQSWLPRRLAKAGNIAQLRTLAKIGNQYAGRELVRLLPTAEALDFARRHAKVYWASAELASLLAKDGRFAELKSRAATGDRYASQTLVALAQQGKLPDGEALLKHGLSAREAAERRLPQD